MIKLFDIGAKVRWRQPYKLGGSIVCRGTVVKRLTRLDNAFEIASAQFPDHSIRFRSNKIQTGEVVGYFVEVPATRGRPRLYMPRTDMLEEQ